MRPLAQAQHQRCFESGVSRRLPDAWGQHVQKVKQHVVYVLTQRSMFLIGTGLGPGFRTAGVGAAICMHAMECLKVHALHLGCEAR